jgi:hypothetical protein
MLTFEFRDDPRCVICGGAEHRDADGMIERCDVVVIVFESEPVRLRASLGHGDTLLDWVG